MISNDDLAGRSIAGWNKACVGVFYGTFRSVFICFRLSVYSYTVVMSLLVNDYNSQILNLSSMLR